MSDEPVRPKLSRRLAIIVFVAVVLRCLCVWWNGSNASFARRSVDDVADTSSLDSQLPSPEEVRASATAIAEVKKRQSWSGKVIFATQEGSTWYVWVEREHSDLGFRQIRLIEIDAQTGKMLRYDSAAPMDVPSEAAAHTTNSLHPR
jgi:hypothetical protein